MLSVYRSHTGIVLVSALMVVASVGGPVSTAHAQQSGPGLQMSPCQDSLYQELRERPLDQLSEREYEYFIRRDRACTRYKIARASSGDSLADGGRRSVCNEQRYRRVLETPADSMEVRQLRFVVRYVQTCQRQADRGTTTQEREERDRPDPGQPTTAETDEPDRTRGQTGQVPAEKEPRKRPLGDETEPPTSETAAESAESDTTGEADSSLNAVRPSGGEVELSTAVTAIGVSPSLRIGTSDNSYLEIVATILAHSTPNLGTGVRGGIDLIDGPALLEFGGSAARFWPGSGETSWTEVSVFATSGWKWAPNEDIAILPTTSLIFRYPISLTVAGEEVPLDQFTAYNGESRGRLNIVFGGKIKLWDTLSFGLTGTSQALPAWYLGIEL